MSQPNTPSERPLAVDGVSSVRARRVRSRRWPPRQQTADVPHRPQRMRGSQAQRQIAGAGGVMRARRRLSCSGSRIEPGAHVRAPDLVPTLFRQIRAPLDGGRTTSASPAANCSSSMAYSAHGLEQMKRICPFVRRRCHSPPTTCRPGSRAHRALSRMTPSPLQTYLDRMKRTAGEHAEPPEQARSSSVSKSWLHDRLLTCGDDREARDDPLSVSSRCSSCSKRSAGARIRRRCRRQLDRQRGPSRRRDLGDVTLSSVSSKSGRTCWARLTNSCTAEAVAMASTPGLLGLISSSSGAMGTPAPTQVQRLATRHEDRRRGHGEIWATARLP